MTGPDARPWWASEPGAEVPDDDPDPLARHRQARAGGAPHDPGGHADRRGRSARDDADPDGAGGASSGGGSGAEGAAGAGVPGWWAPAAEAVARLSEDLAATATANADAARGRPSWDDGHDDASTPPRGTGDQTGDVTDPAHLDVCGICPICVALRTLGAHRPELVGHLTEAARHLAAAVRSIADPGGEPAPREGGGASADDGLTRIDLDDLGAADGSRGPGDGPDPTPGGPGRG